MELCIAWAIDVIVLGHSRCCDDRRNRSCAKNAKFIFHVRKEWQWQEHTIKNVIGLQLRALLLVESFVPNQDVQPYDIKQLVLSVGRSNHNLPLIARVMSSHLNATSLSFSLTTLSCSLSSSTFFNLVWRSLIRRVLLFFHLPSISHIAKMFCFS